MCSLNGLVIICVLTNVEPVYHFKEILKEEGYLNNYRKEKQLESSMERAKIISDSDCCLHESISHAYWVRSQTNRHKKYLVTWYRANFIACDFPWSIRNNMWKHAIKVDWLYFPLGDSIPVLDHDTTHASFDTPHKIAPNLHVDGDITFTSTDTVDPNVEGLQLDRD